jgi:UDP-N-acetylglucosamine 4-epimerase
MSAGHDDVWKALQAAPKRWLVTGCAGFIGSALVERLLALDQQVVGLDNFATGRQANLDDVLGGAGEARTAFTFLEGDIRDPEACARAMAGVDVVLHQAALGSVPRSLLHPELYHANNVTGFVNVLLAARDAGVRRVVYASSSSVYGDHPGLPKVESTIGRPLSPYAATKRIDEVYAEAFGPSYGLELVGLRYFNVFGRRQNPKGDYAAVIPRWIDALLAGDPCRIFGDGTASRDFCYVDNVVMANILAATAGPEATGEVYNVGCHERTTVLELFSILRDNLATTRPELAHARPEFLDARPGDIPHSLADIGKITHRLGYAPAVPVAEGLARTVAWFATRVDRGRGVTLGVPVLRPYSAACNRPREGGEDPP